MKLQHCLVALAALALPATANAAGSLIVNGDFTQTSTTAANGNFELTANGQYGTVTGWSTSNSPTNNNPYNLLYTTGAGANVAQTSTTAGSPSNPNSWALGQYGSSADNEYIAYGYNGTSPTGGNFMALDGDPSVNGYLSQSVGGLTAGKLYELDFYWAVAELASRPYNSAITDYLQVSFSGVTDQTQTLTINQQGWVKQTYFFTAQAATQTLSFLAVGTPAGAPPMALLDGISLTAAPEPSTFVVLATGIGALAFVTRRRRQSKAPTAA